MEPTNLQIRIRNHIMQMAPHQKAREGGLLLMQAESEIALLRKRLADIESDGTIDAKAFYSDVAKWEQ